MLFIRSSTVRHTEIMETSNHIIHNWQDQIQELASQYGIPREEMEVIVYDIQNQEQTLEWLTQPRVQKIVKHRKGRWTQVRVKVQ